MFAGSVCCSLVLAEEERQELPDLLTEALIAGQFIVPLSQILKVVYHGDKVIIE